MFRDEQVGHERVVRQTEGESLALGFEPIRVKSRLWGMGICWACTGKRQACGRGFLVPPSSVGSTEKPAKMHRNCAVADKCFDRLVVLSEGEYP